MIATPEDLKDIPIKNFQNVRGSLSEHCFGIVPYKLVICLLPAIDRYIWRNASAIISDRRHFFSAKGTLDLPKAFELALKPRFPVPRIVHNE